MEKMEQGYISSMEKPIRGRSDIIVLLDNSDPSAAVDGQWAGNGIFYSDAHTVNYNTNYGPTVYTIEPNRCLLDDNFEYLDRSKKPVDGFIAYWVQGSAGFSQVFTKEFSQPHDIPGISIQFDTRCHEYPHEVRIEYINSAGNSTGIKVFPNDSEDSSFEFSAKGVKKVNLWFGRYPYPKRRARVEQVKFGSVKKFSGNQISGAVRKDDVDPLCRRLPKQTFTFSVLDYGGEYDFDNPQGAWRKLTDTAEIAVCYKYTDYDTKNVYFTPWHKYVLDGQPDYRNHIATFNATAILGTMRKPYYKCKAGSKNVYNLVEDILIDSGIPKRPNGARPWIIDASLKNKYAPGILPIATHAECLQMICHAFGMIMYTDANGYINIKPYTVPTMPENPFTIGYNTILGDGLSGTKNPKLGSIEVYEYWFPESQEEKMLADVKVTGLTAHIEFQPAVGVKAIVTGDTKKSEKFYAQAADLEFGSEKAEKNVKIYGRPMDKVSIVRTEQIGDGETDTEKNPLVTSIFESNSLRSRFVEYLKKRTVYDIIYRGNPELEVGDLIRLQTRFSGYIDAIIISSEIAYNGALRGHIIAKGIGEEAEAGVRVIGEYS